MRQKKPKKSPIKKYEPDPIPTQREILELSRKLVLKPEDPDRVEPKTLTSIQIDSILEYFRYSQNTSIEKLAALVDMSKSAVMNRLRKIDEAYKTRVLSLGDINPEKRFAELLRMKEIAQQKAMDAGNWSLVWKIEAETVASMEKLGLIQRDKPYDPNVIDAEFVEVIKEDVKQLSPPGGDSSKVEEQVFIEEKNEPSKMDIYEALKNLRQDK